jgi:hypothetical protein
MDSQSPGTTTSVSANPYGQLKAGDFMGVYPIISDADTQEPNKTAQKIFRAATPEKSRVLYQNRRGTVKVRSGQRRHAR